MQRPASEVLASQRKMLERSGKRGADLEAAALTRTYAMQLAAVNRWVENRPLVELLPVPYHALVSCKTELLEQIADFLQREITPTTLNKVVDPALYRERG